MGEEEKSVDLHRSILEYFESTGIIQQIKESAIFYNGVQDKAFHFKIPIDTFLLFDINCVLGNCVLSYPARAAKLFQEVVFTTIRTLNLLPECTSASQVVVSFLIQSLPSLPGYQLKSARDLSRHCLTQGHKLYSGWVIGTCLPHKYTKSARFLCTDDNCEGSDGNKFIRLHTAGAREAQTIRTDFKCSYCGLPLREDLASRVLADKLVLELVDREAMSSSKEPSTSPSATGNSNAYHQSLVLYLRDEQVNHKIDIGQKLTVIGVPVFDMARSKLAFELNNILPNEESKPKGGRNLPDTIEQLYNDRKKSPWSFALSLAFAFAGHFAPVGTFLHLKLGLLLSLVGGSQDKWGLDLLVFGADFLLLHRLLDYAASFSDHSISHTSQRHLTAAVIKDKHDVGVPFIEGGSILLARDGICLIPQLDTASKQTKYSLLQVLETNNVFVDVSKKMSKQQEQPLFLPRKCSIWSYTTPETSHKALAASDLMQSEATPLSPDVVPLVDAFGMCYSGEVPAGSYAESQLTHHTLQHAKGFSSHTLIPEEHFREFIRMARNQTVEITSEAESLIKSYYVTSRRMRANSAHVTQQHFPRNAVTTLTKLAEAFAKLSMHREVSIYDVTMAILLYEEAVTFRTGYSVLHVKPLVHIEDNDIHKYIGPERDAQMMHFYSRLKLFCVSDDSSILTNSFLEEE